MGLKAESDNVQDKAPIGRDDEGHWVVRDRVGMHTAWFYDRTSALRYAFAENVGRPRAIIMVPGILKVDFGRA